MNRIFIILIFILLAHSCKYEPILINKKFDYKFDNITYEGDEQINVIIKNDMIKKGNGSKKYDIKYVTAKDKKVFSSNEKGDPTIYSLKITTSYIILEDGVNILQNNIEKRVTYNNLNDKFELSKYERNIIENLSLNISSEILMSVTSLDK
tara:strand:- start:3015 stop:3467 length:453 start_codon:yes stop_codon:yes gene_type:complete